MGLAPHPHIGLQTVTWIPDGEVAVVQPGGVKVMTSGSGIAHTEQTPAQNSGKLNGVQLWVALPDADRNIDPFFENMATVPAVESMAGIIQVFAGSCGCDVSHPPLLEFGRCGRKSSPWTAARACYRPELRTRCAVAGRRVRTRRSAVAGTAALPPWHPAVDIDAEQHSWWTSAPDRRTAVSRDDPDAVERRRADTGGDLSGTRRLGGASPFGVSRSTAQRADLVRFARPESG